MNTLLKHILYKVYKPSTKHKETWPDWLCCSPRTNEKCSKQKYVKKWGGMETNDCNFFHLFRFSPVPQWPVPVWKQSLHSCQVEMRWIQGDTLPWPMSNKCNMCCFLQDCTDGTDESNCTVVSCPDDKFNCPQVRTSQPILFHQLGMMIILADWNFPTAQTGHFHLTLPNYWFAVLNTDKIG